MRKRSAATLTTKESAEIMSTLFQNLRYTLRGLTKAPGFTAVVVLSLGLGIGAVATAFTWVDFFLLRPFPLVRESNRLVGLHTEGPGGVEWSVSYPKYLQWRNGVKSFDGLVVFSMQQFSLRVDDATPERVWSEVVSGNYFDVLGVHAARGRTFQADEEAQAAQAAIISRALWSRKFNNDPGVVGRRVTLNGQGFTVIGVAPSGFGGTVMGLGADLWVLVTTIPALSPGNTSLTSPGWQWLEALGRLRPGVTLEQARSDLRDATKRIGAEAGESVPTVAIAKPIGQEGVGQFIGPLIYTLLGIGGLILLIACANVANLLMVRGIQRGKEVGIRLAIGAGRSQLVRQLLTESFVLAVLGGLAGLLVAYWGQGAIAAVVPAMPFPIDLTTHLNIRVLGVTTVVACITALVFGLVPALRATRVDLVPVLKDENAPGTTRPWGRSALVVVQVAFSLVALVSAGLFFRSNAKALGADPGFRDPEHVLIASTDLHLAGLRDSAGAVVRDRLLERLRTVPGVTRVSLTTKVPMTFWSNNSSSATVEGYTAARNENMSIMDAFVGPDYFETLGVRITRGRGILETDRTGAPKVAVVNDAFARRFWSNQDPIGKRIDMGWGWVTIVGTAADVKISTIGETPFAFVYHPHAQVHSSEFDLLLRTSVDPKSVIESVRRVFASVDANLPMLDPRTLRENMQSSLFVQTTASRLLGGLGFVALLLASIGLYGVLSYTVRQRTKEIGLRVALGAATSSVVGLVFRQALRLIVAGLAVGTILAFGVGRLVSGQLYGVSPSDPITFVAIASLLCGVAVLASLLPARRATRVDPLVALRNQ